MLKSINNNRGFVTVPVMIIIGALLVSVLIYINSENSGNVAETFGGSPTKPSQRIEEVETQPINHTLQYVDVKYRDGRVNIAHPRFEYLNTERSSFIGGAWYDKQNQYMIISLSSVYYHYCSLPKGVWSSFKVTPSFGKYYNYSIKGRYDCRIYPVPRYEEDD